MQPHPIFCKSLQELPQSVCFVWFSHLTVLKWWQWSHFTYNQSIEILILGFPLSFKNFDYSAQQKNIWLWDQSCTPFKDGNGLSHFGIWPSENFLIYGHRVTPRVCRSRWNSMTWVNLERIYIVKATLGFKRNPKESACETNIRCTSLAQLSLGIFCELLGKWVIFLNVQVRTSWFFFLPFYIFFQQSQACAGSIPESQIKSKISHSLIHMGFIGLVTWLRVRGLWKKGLDRLKECLRVILSKNLESVARTFCSFQLLGWALLLLSYTLIFCCTLVHFL